MSNTLLQQLNNLFDKILNKNNTNNNNNNIIIIN